MILKMKEATEQERFEMVDLVFNVFEYMFGTKTLTKLVDSGKLIVNFRDLNTEEDVRNNMLTRGCCTSLAEIESLFGKISHDDEDNQREVMERVFSNKELFADDTAFIIEMDYHCYRVKTIKSTVSMIIHELTHLRQCMEGRLVDYRYDRLIWSPENGRYNINEGTFTMWNGTDTNYLLDNHKILGYEAYLALPWEVEARAEADRLTDEVMVFLRKKWGTA